MRSPQGMLRVANIPMHGGCGFDDEVEPEKMLKKGRPVLAKEQQLEEEGKDIIICLLLSLSLSSSRGVNVSHRLRTCVNT